MQRRKLMTTAAIRELTADELEAVSGGSKSPVNIKPNAFDKLLASIDKNLEMVKQLKPGGYLPPG